MSDLSALRQRRHDTARAHQRFVKNNDSRLGKLHNRCGWRYAAATCPPSVFAGFPDATKLDLSKWDTSKVNDMERSECLRACRHSKFTWPHSRGHGGLCFLPSAVFLAALCEPDIATWDTSSVKTLKGAFASAKNFDGDLSKWNTAQVTNMYATFKDASAFNGDVSAWSTGKVTTMAQMFQTASSFNGDLSSWDTSSA